MLNVTVPAAATGLPSPNRRSFLKGASVATTAVALPGAAAAGAHRPDPVFAALAEAVEANRIFEATLTELSAAHRAVLALGYGYEPRVEHAGALLRSHADICTAFDIERMRFPTVAAKLDAAEAKLIAEFDRQAEAIRAVEVEQRVAELEHREDTESDAAIAAEVEALSTVPTTLAGIAALAEFLSLPRIAGGDHAITGAQSIAAACRNLITS